MPNPIQTAIGSWNGTATTATVSPSTFPTATDQIIVGVFIYFNSGVQSVSSIADNATGSSTYVKIGATQSGGSNTDIELWWCPSVGTGSGTFTVTATLSGNAQAICRVMECSGLSAVDVSNTASGSSGSGSASVTNGSANTSATDFVVTMIGLEYDGSNNPNPTYPPNSGYTGWYNDNGFLTYVNSNGGYKTLSGIETSSASWTFPGDNDAWGAVLATFKGAAAPNNATVAWLT